MNNMTDKKSMRTLCRKLRNSIDKKTEKADIIDEKGNFNCCNTSGY